MIDKLTEGIKAWLVRVFASTITGTIRPEDRQAAILWLAQSRSVVASDLSAAEKLKRLNSLISSKAAFVAIAKNVSEAVKNYKNSNLSWPMKIALPATLAAIPFIGGQGAGVAAFGGAVGVPALLLIFLGAAGITSIIESLVRNPSSRSEIERAVEVILNDERLRRASAELKAAMRVDAMEARRHEMPDDEIALRNKLHTMDPYDFEQHALSFFKAAGFPTTLTKRSNDLGVDGIVLHPEGLVIIQCKRNSIENKVGGPIIQQFKGVIEEQNAVRGYVITTSAFTSDALRSAQLSAKIVLVDMDQLVLWHRAPPTFH